MAPQEQTSSNQTGVRVHFVDGRCEAFPFATNAVNRGPVFNIERYFPAQRTGTVVQSFLTVDVAYALVFEPSGPRWVAGSTPAER